MGEWDYSDIFMFTSSYPFLMAESYNAGNSTYMYIVVQREAVGIPA